ncbi:MAG: response regulator [Alphaproteobacteria bacterium]
MSLGNRQSRWRNSLDRAQAFSSAEEFLASPNIDKTRCLILDIAMPGMSGPDLQRELLDRKRRVRIIFMTAQDGALPSRVIEQGAVACLLKPFSDSTLQRALEIAFS